MTMHISKSANLARRSREAALTSLILFGLIACGGGGGGGGSPAAPPPPTNPPASPTLTLGIGLKQLQFSWAPVATTTVYRLMVKADAAAAFTQSGADMPPTQTNVNVDLAVHTH